MVRLWILTVGTAWGVATSALVAAGPPVQPIAAHSVLAATPATLGDDELRIREVFRSHLPRTLKANALRLGVHPHLGDFNTKDHLRVTAGLRYGLTERCEISLGGDLYSSHGHGSVRSFERYGMAHLEFGTKINLGQRLRPGWDSTAGFDYGFPTGHPPAELTDGLRHFTSYLTFSRRLETHRQVRLFWGLRVDAVTRTSIPGEFRRNALRDSSTGVTAGFVIDRQNWHYTFETAFDTTRLLGRNDEDLFVVRPGVIWEILSRRHPRSRSNWTVGAALSSTWGPDGTRLGGSLKIRYNLDLKRVAR